MHQYNGFLIDRVSGDSLEIQNPPCTVGLQAHLDTLETLADESTPEALKAAADLVLVGTVDSVVVHVARVNWHNYAERIVVHVDTATVSLTAQVAVDVNSGDPPMTVYPRFTVGEEVLLFVDEEAPGQYSLHGGSAGKWTVENGVAALRWITFCDPRNAPVMTATTSSLLAH
ncbi:MAG: hypothetical protein R3E12_09285 [Candidatus Eisenbacteria bacterium]